MPSRRAPGFTVTASAPATATVGITSGQLVASNTGRKGLTILNNSTGSERFSLAFGAAAVLDSGLTLYPGDVFNMGEHDFSTDVVNAIASAGTAAAAMQEWT